MCPCPEIRTVLLFVSSNKRVYLLPITDIPTERFRYLMTVIR